MSDKVETDRGNFDRETERFSSQIFSLSAGVYARRGFGRNADAGLFSEGAPELGELQGRVEPDDVADADRDQPTEGPLAESADAVLADHSDQFGGFGRGKRMAA